MDAGAISYACAHDARVILVRVFHQAHPVRPTRLGHARVNGATSCRRRRSGIHAGLNGINGVARCVCFTLTSPQTRKRPHTVATVVILFCALPSLSCAGFQSALLETKGFSERLHADPTDIVRGRTCAVNNVNNYSRSNKRVVNKYYIMGRATTGSYTSARRYSGERFLGENLSNAVMETTWSCPNVHGTITKCT